ncbi:MAG TPA: hypothetical protein VK698_26985 [Kofleriaceae bacterium]|nr:hypothetical protein [Kofleriaceae bacterium]
MTDRSFRVVVGIIFLGIAAIVARVSFFHPVDLPAIPPPPVPARAEVVTARATAAIDRDPAAFADRLASDSKALRIEPVATPADLSGVFAHRWDDKRRELEPGGHHASAEVLGLAMTLSIERAAELPRRQLVLTVENTTADHLAYRIVTQSSRGLRPCHGKSDIAHDAFALAPGETARRSECIYRKGLKLFVDRVETIRLPRLSYYYVSDLPASALGVERSDQLAARGHRPAKGRSPCRVYQSAELTGALIDGSATWRDLVDFYARHPCRSYSFPIGYKAFNREEERPLPAVPDGP